jgi:hypothetical protein
MKADRQLRGVKIYDTDREYSNLVDEWSALRINTAFVSEHLLSDSAFREAALKKQIDLFVITPVFYDKHALRRKPELFAITNLGKRAELEWVRFVCPSIQVKEHYLSDRFSVDEFSRSHIEALRSPSDGVSYWSWEALEIEPEKKKVIRTN